MYHGRALGEFKTQTYARGLERHLNKYPGLYITGERKVARALIHMTLNLQIQWERYIRDMPGEHVTYGGLCTFLIHQLQIGVYPEVAKARYMESYQRPFSLLPSSPTRYSRGNRISTIDCQSVTACDTATRLTKLNWTSLIMMISSSTCKGKRTVVYRAGPLREN